MADTPTRRRKLVVHKATQKRIVLAVVLVPTIGLAASTMVVAMLCRRLLTESLQVDAELPSLTPLLVSVLVFFVVCSLVMAVQGLRFSHRIAGPAYRIRKSLGRIRTGDIGFRVTLRRGDYLTEIADELNATLDWLNCNQPGGVVSTGGDVVEVDSDDSGILEGVADLSAVAADSNR